MRKLLLLVSAAALALPGCSSWSSEDVVQFCDVLDRVSVVAKRHGLRVDAEVSIRERSHFGLIEAVVIESPIDASIRACLDPAVAEDEPVEE